jgi:hypothetical protein
MMSVYLPVLFSLRFHSMQNVVLLVVEKQSERQNMLRTFAVPTGPLIVRCEREIVEPLRAATVNRPMHALVHFGMHAHGHNIASAVAIAFSPR